MRGTARWRDAHQSRPVPPAAAELEEEEEEEEEEETPPALPAAASPPPVEAPELRVKRVKES